jgi:hypothetical protein
MPVTCPVFRLNMNTSPVQVGAIIYLPLDAILISQALEKYLHVYEPVLASCKRCCSFAIDFDPHLLFVLKPLDLCQIPLAALGIRVDQFVQRARVVVLSCQWNNNDYGQSIGLLRTKEQSLRAPSTHRSFSLQNLATRHLVR